MNRSPFRLFNLVILILARAATSEKLLIIGAGPSGIAAATKLLKNNFDDFFLVEAEDRIGGRIFTVKFGDAHVDMGAQWVHGERDNTVFEMVKDLNLLAKGNFMENGLFSYSNREGISGELNDELFRLIWEIYFEDGGDKANLTLGDYCLREFKSKISSLKLHNATEENFVRDFLDYFESYTISSEGCFSWYQPSAESDFRDSEGRLDWNWNGRGYRTILDVLMQKFPNTSEPLPIDERILLNKEVRQISWDDGGGNVTVSCADGTAYTANLVLFTPSLGVLKERHGDMFVPALPVAKRRAIETLGIGAVMKVMLLFPRSWWPNGSDFNGFNFVWSAEHRNLSEFQLNGRTWVNHIFAVIPVEKNPNVLSAWIVGPVVPDVEKLDGKSLLKGINFALRQFLGHRYDISYPISFVRSTWYTNPHFRGTYSYQTIESRKARSNHDLAEPLINSNGKEAVLFAGEATNPIHYSTVNGAIETGFREADRIINMFNKLNE